MAQQVDADAEGAGVSANTGSAPAPRRRPGRYLDGRRGTRPGGRADAGDSERSVIPIPAWIRRLRAENSQRSPGPAGKAPWLLFPTTIGARNVLCFKSELHMSQDGPKLPIRDLWKQIIDETGAHLVITTGTAGGIGAAVKLGRRGRQPRGQLRLCEDLQRGVFHNQSFSSPARIPTAYFSIAVKQLLPINADQLPEGNGLPAFRPSKRVPKDTVVTTDFFAFDTTDNEYGLQKLGAAVEMGDAVLGLVSTQDLAGRAPAFCAVRNASDPQIEADLSKPEQRKKAAQIYEKYGYWTSIGSAIVTWAVIAAAKKK